MQSRSSIHTTTTFSFKHPFIMQSHSLSARVPEICQPIHDMGELTHSLPYPQALRFYLLGQPLSPQKPDLELTTFRVLLGYNTV
jgi:hypothetical protein